MKQKKTITSAVVLANAMQRRLSTSSSLYLSKDRIQRVREDDNTQHPKTTIKNTPKRKKTRVRSSNLRKKKAAHTGFVFLFYLWWGQTRDNKKKEKREEKPNNNNKGRHRGNHKHATIRMCPSSWSHSTRLHSSRTSAHLDTCRGRYISTQLRCHGLSQA